MTPFLTRVMSKQFVSISHFKNLNVMPEWEIAMSKLAPLRHSTSVFQIFRPFIHD